MTAPSPAALDLSLPKTTPEGLTEAEVVARRARRQGNNDAPRTGRTYAQIARENVFTFINLVLIGLGVALVLLGRWSDAAVSVGVVGVNLLVGVVQEVRAKRTLDRIALLTRPTATVIRDGQARPVDPSEIVLGDTLRLRPGDQIVVDDVVLSGGMDVDESLLTGESDLVSNASGDTVYSDSFCVSGGGCYEATNVGSASLANQLTAGARAFRRIYTPLQQEINHAVRLILVLAICMAIAPLRDFFELAPLGLADVAVLVGVTCAWTLAVRWAWRARLLDQLITRA